MTIQQRIHQCAVRREEARRQLEKIGAVVEAVSACGDAYAPYLDMFCRDLKAANDHLATCEKSMMDVIKESNA